MSTTLKLCIVLFAAAWAMAVTQAAPIAIEDGNSTAWIDPDSEFGMYEWTVNGTNHLARQWFWYRLEGMGHEKSLNQLGFLGSQTTDTNFLMDSRPDTLTAYYGDLSGFYVEIKFALQGGLSGSGSSDIAEQIAFHNQTGETVRIWFFQYSDFDLNGTPDNDTVSIAGGNTVSQTDAGATISETVVVPKPVRFEVNYYPNTLDSLNDDAITILNNDADPLAGNVTWTFEWEFAISPGGSIHISKDKNLIPEPATMSLLAVGGLAMIRCRRK